jgi:hypothetical protein
MVPVNDNRLRFGKLLTGPLSKQLITGKHSQLYIFEPHIQRNQENFSFQPQYPANKIIVTSPADIA